MRKIPDEVLVRVKDPGTHFDSHCHTFNREDVPNGFLGVRIPYTRRVISLLERMTKRVGVLFKKDGITGTSYFLNLFKQRDAVIAERLLSYYDAHTIVCPLMVDMEPSIKGRMKSSYPAQLKTMEALCKARPGRLLPFVGLNPIRHSMNGIFIDELMSADSVFWGVKLYPSLGYLPSHPDLMNVYEYCEKHRIPITVHCSAATVKTTRHRIKSIRYTKVENGKRVDQVIRKRWFWRSDYDWFNDPKHWEVVFEVFPKLVVNFAHFGGFEQWRRYAKGKDNTWVHRIISLMQRYENVYADISYTLHDRRIYPALKAALEASDTVCVRTLYGSDYYMLVREGHFRSIRTGFEVAMGRLLMVALTHTNPRRFLFGEAKDRPELRN